MTPVGRLLQGGVAREQTITARAGRKGRSAASAGGGPAYEQRGPRSPAAASKIATAQAPERPRPGWAVAASRAMDHFRPSIATAPRVGNEPA